jgi:hypothetical protein
MWEFGKQLQGNLLVYTGTKSNDVSGFSNGAILFWHEITKQCPRLSSSFQNLGKGVAFNVGSSKTHQKTLTLSCLKSSRNTEMDVE